MTNAELTAELERWGRLARRQKGPWSLHEQQQIERIIKTLVGRTVMAALADVPCFCHETMPLVPNGGPSRSDYCTRHLILRRVGGLEPIAALVAELLATDEP